MESTRSQNSLFKQYAFIWDSSFSRRQKENRYFKENSIGEAVARQQSDVKTILTKFLETFCEGDVERYSYRSIQLEKFLGDIGMGELEAGSQQSNKKLVLVDDRNNSTASRTKPGGESRPFRGPLAAPQFYKLLQEPRYIERGESEAVALPNAERRLIYINDVDRLNILAMVATAPKSQISVLRDFIHRHLAYGAFFGVAIPPRAFDLTFTLEFHLPFYAWRKCKDLRLDSRHMENGVPFRYSQCVIPINRKKSSNNRDQIHDCIYEAQISVMVTGLDEWFWTGYCFVDTYYHREGEGESATIFANESGELPRKMDPVSGGKLQLDVPIWDPREYFLRTLLCRMEQVKQEWNNAVDRLLQEINPYTSRETSNAQDTKDHDITQKEGYKWTVRILRQFTNLLMKIIDAWEVFKDGPIGYFYPQGTASMPRESWGRYLASIDRCVTELRGLRGSLLHQTEMLETMTNSLSTHAALAENRITRLQSEFVQALTIITILYLPPSLASTIYSMQQSFLKTPVDLKDYVLLLLALSVFTLGLLVVVNDGTRKLTVRVAGRCVEKLLQAIEEIKENYRLPNFNQRLRRSSLESGIEMEEQARTESGTDVRNQSIVI